MSLIDTTNVFCRVCGKALWSAKAKKKGIGSSCERKEKREQEIKPYIREMPFVETGGTDYGQRVYGEFSTWEDGF